MPDSSLDAETIRAWFEAHRPAAWHAAPLELLVDNDEILVIVVLPDTDGSAPGHGADESARGHGVDESAPGDEARIELFREQSRDDRIRLAAGAEHRFRRKVSWGARLGEVVATFTTASVPVMTRLRLPERRVLDTLIDAGVARSRSDALAWCVRLVGHNETEWISELRGTFAAVERIRAKGPRSTRPQPEE